MKKFIYTTVVAATLLSGCQKYEDLVFDKKPYEREAAIIASLNQALADPNGWVLDVYTTSGKGYSFYCVFNNQNRVTMLSDIDDNTTTKSMESSYLTKVIQQPTILFDTYSYIHRLADPMPDEGGGNGGGLGNEPGVGLGSDYEFGVTAESIDSLQNYPAQIKNIKTIGRFNQLPVTFRRATATEAADWKAGKIKEFKKKVNAYNASGILSVEGPDNSKGDIWINPADKNMIVCWIEKGTAKSLKTSFTYNDNYLSVQDTININGLKIKNLYWSDADSQLGYSINNALMPLTVSDSASVPAKMLLGTVFTDITIPEATDYGGWSRDFAVRRSFSAIALKKAYSLILKRMLFTFSEATKTCTFRIEIFQDGNQFFGVFNLTYDKSSEGIFKFSKAASGYLGSNAALTESKIAFILGQRLLTDSFKPDFYIDPEYGKLIIFRSIENPDFTFTCVF